MREVAQANGVRLSDQEVSRLCVQCIRDFGGQDGITAENFEKYVRTMPDLFGPLVIWRALFDCYAVEGPGGRRHIREQDTAKLVSDASECNGYAMTDEEAGRMAQDLVREADQDGDGSIDFAEFVQFARKHPHVFERLREEILSPRNMSLDDAELAGRVFRDADKDGSGTLDGDELVEVLRKVANAAGLRYMTTEELQQEALACLRVFGGESGVTLDEFQRYAATKPDLFGALYQWREFFNKYASLDAEGQLEISEAGCIKLVQEVCEVNGTQITPAQAQVEAKKLMFSADIDGNGSINFGEFVKYARAKEDLFGRMKARILSPYMSPQKRKMQVEEQESLDHDHLANRVFSEADKDNSGFLDGNELVEVLKKLIQAANLKAMSRADLEREARDCLNRFGAPFGSAAAQGVTLDGFKAYAASKPELFGPLYKWREFFNKYASMDAQGSLEIQLEDCEKLVMDVCSLNGNPMSAAQAKAEAEALMEAADADRSGSVNFGEFVSYARLKGDLFGKIAQQIMSPYMSPRKDRGQATTAMGFEDVKFAEKLFKDADKDGNGTLDQNELGKVLREMVKAAGLTVSGPQVNDELGKCLRQFGDGSTVAFQGFLRYAASRPEWFGPLFQWREFFNKYACPQSGEMQLEQAQKFMKDV